MAPFEPAMIPRVLTVAAMLGLATWLLLLRFAAPVNRALALYLSLRALAIATSLLNDLDPGSGWGAIARYFLLAVPFAAISFALVYYREYGAERGSRTAPVTRRARALLLVLVIAIELAYLLNHDLWADAAGRRGPLILIGDNGAGALAQGIVAYVLAREGLRLPYGDARSSLFLAAIGFSLTAFFVAVHNVIIVPAALLGFDIYAGLGQRLATVPYELAGRLMRGVGAFLVFSLLAVQLYRHRPNNRFPLTPRERRLIAWPLGVVALSALVNLGFYVARSSLANDVDRFLVGIWTLATPLVLTYAILKHQLFGIDRKVRKGISRGVLAGIFLAVFFVAAQIAQNFLSEEYGYAVGGAVAGLMLFVITPIQRVAERVAQAAMPSVPPNSQLGARPAATVYREAIELMLEDRRITGREELHLAHLAESLGLGAGDATRIRLEVQGQKHRRR